MRLTGAAAEQVLPHRSGTDDLAWEGMIFLHWDDDRRDAIAEGCRPVVKSTSTVLSVLISVHRTHTQSRTGESPGVLLLTQPPGTGRGSPVLLLLLVHLQLLLLLLR